MFSLNDELMKRIEAELAETKEILEKSKTPDL